MFELAVGAASALVATRGKSKYLIEDMNCILNGMSRPTVEIRSSLVSRESIDRVRVHLWHDHCSETRRLSFPVSTTPPLDLLY